MEEYDCEIWVRYPCSMNRRQASVGSVFLPIEMREREHFHVRLYKLEIYKKHGQRLISFPLGSKHSKIISLTWPQTSTYSYLSCPRHRLPPIWFTSIAPSGFSSVLVLQLFQQLQQQLLSQRQLLTLPSERHARSPTRHQQASPRNHVLRLCWTTLLFPLVLRST